MASPTLKAETLGDEPPVTPSTASSSPNAWVDGGKLVRKFGVDPVALTARVESATAGEGIPI
jgi:hypothetical protein